MLLKQYVQKNVQIIVAIITAIIFVGLIASFSNVHTASAVNNTANTLKISPVRTDVEIEKGTSKSVPVNITNLTKEDITVRPFENDFVSGDERGTPALILDADKFAPTHSLKRFMTPLADVTIPASKTKTINVVITVPKDAQAGGYFGAVRFAPTTPDGGGQVNLSASVASLILTTVPGDVVEKLNLSNFDIQQAGISGDRFSSSNDLQATVRFENKGGVQIGPFGKVSVKEGDKVVYETDFNVENPRDVILPDSARRWDIPLKKIGSFGHYTVSATFTYGKTNQTFEVSKSFWVIPQSVIIAAIVGLVLLVAIIVIIVLLLNNRRRRNQRGRSLGSTPHHKG